MKDEPQKFISALRRKYAPGADQPTITDSQIEISGKVVEEVGFDKIRQQLARLDQLKIVIVDGLCIAAAETEDDLEAICPHIVELDLSRNLFSCLVEIVHLCENFQELRRLRIKYA